MLNIKKIILFVLSAAILLSSLLVPGMITFAENDEIDVWDGKTASTTYDGGDGLTPETAFQISNGAQLAGAIFSGGGNKYYKLTADIYLNDVTNPNWKDNTPNVWTTDALFNGFIDGNNNIIYGLYYNATEYKPAGLIPQNGKNTTISNLGLSEAYVSSDHYVGGFLGYSATDATANANSQANFTNCFIDETCYIATTHNSASVGGLIGYFSNQGTSKVVIDTCYVTATVAVGNASNTYPAGGLLGRGYNVDYQIKNSYTTSAQAVGHNRNGTRNQSKNANPFVNVYATANASDYVVKDWNVVSATQMTGLFALENMSALSKDDWTAVEGKTPVLTPFLDKLVKPEGPQAPTEDDKGIWTGAVSKSFADKSAGTESDPILIQNAGELALMIKSGGNGLYYKLTKDIYLNDVSNDKWAETAKNSWNNVSTTGFYGTIDGDGNIIYGLYASKTAADDDAGLVIGVPAGKTATFTRLGIRYANLSSPAGTAGAFVGRVKEEDSKAVFTQCFVDETVFASGVYAGGFVGYVKINSTECNVTIDNCFSLAEITAPDNRSYGKFLASYTGKWQIKNSYSNGKLYKASGNDKFVSTMAPNAYVNCYAVSKCDDKDTVQGNSWTVLSIAQMTGPAAKDNMSLDFDTVWTTVLTGTPVLKLFAEKLAQTDDKPVEDDKGIWTGAVSKSFADKSAGTESDPILIQNAGELALMIKSGGNGLYYKLTKDIYLNDVSKKNWYDESGNNSWFYGTTSISNKVASVDGTAPNFNGHIDGAGFIVYGLYYNTTVSGRNIGLIPQVFDTEGKKRDVSIKNLGMRHAYIKNTAWISGAFIGRANGNVITIDKCFVDETVIISATWAGGFIGGAEGHQINNLAQVDITNSYSKATVAAPTYSGSVVAKINKASLTFKNGYATDTEVHYSDSDVNTQTLVSADKEPFKNGYGSVAANSANTKKWTVVDKANMYGELARQHMPGLDYTNVFQTVEGGTPILKLFKGKVTGEDIDISLDDSAYESGKGTKDDPYIIKTLDQLKYLVASSSTSGKFYKLANDIYVNDTTKANWKDTATPWFTEATAGAFAGYLEGDGHTIYGLYLNQTPGTTEQATYKAGLFPLATAGATIRNLHVRNSYISGRNDVGAIVGCTNKEDTTPVTIMGCSADESVTLKGYMVGGLVGRAYPAPVDISFSYSTAKLESTAYIYGLLGNTHGTNSTRNNFSNCYTIGYKPTRDEKGRYNKCAAVYSDVACTVLPATVVEKSAMYGSAAKTAMPDLQWGTAWYTEEGKTPQLKKISAVSLEGTPGAVWSGFVATGFAGGNGTKADPYIIETAEQLAYLVLNLGSTKDNYYKITRDIRLNDTSKPNWEKNAREWYEGGDIAISTIFQGHLDGGYHVITGLYFNKKDGKNCALFGSMTAGAVIEKLGIDNSTIINENVNLPANKYAYGAAFVGQLHNWDKDGHSASNIWTGSMDDAPMFSECFVGPGVTLKGNVVGGFIGGSGAGARFFNCYSVPSIPSYSYRGGSFFGDAWQAYESGMELTNCYASTPDREKIGNGTKYDSPVANPRYNNVYVDGLPNDKITIVASSLYAMQGDRAATLMKGFDFKNVWKTVKNGTPVLRGFANDKYSCKREAPKVKIEFVTGDGASQHEPVWGFPLGSKVPYDQFPTPTRYGYKFVGWHAFDTCDYEFKIETFPNYNCYVYAKWEAVGFIQDFEGDTYPEYDVNAGAQYYQPGVAGYNPKNIHTGLRSMQVLADGTEAPMFLVGYKTPLEIGKEYDINFWMSSKEDGASGQIEVLHALYGDVNDDIVGHEVGLEFTGLTAGEWIQYRITFVANAPYIVFRTTPGVELFFDDFHVVPTGNEGEIGKVDGFNPNLLSPEPEGGLLGGVLNSGKELVENVLALGLIGVIILIAAAVIFLAIIVLIIIIIVRSVKNKKAAKAAALAAAAAETPAVEQETPGTEE